MTTHVHSWTPIPLATARYECECGATGRRKGGAIVEQKTDRRRKSWEAQPMGWLVECKDGAE